MWDAKSVEERINVTMYSPYKRIDSRDRDHMLVIQELRNLMLEMKGNGSRDKRVTLNSGSQLTHRRIDMILYWSPYLKNRLLSMMENNDAMESLESWKNVVGKHLKICLE